MPSIQKIADYFKDYTNNGAPWRIVLLVFDILLVLALIILITKVLKIKFKAKKLILFILAVAGVYGVTFFLDLRISLAILKVIAFWAVGILVIVYSQEIKRAFELGLHTNVKESVYHSEKEKMDVVNIIVNSACYLKERKIGALISIERNDSLDTFIDKAIYIKGNITEELLTSLFFVGSATHDGAVIIRKNNIMCAGAYLPSTDKYDIPKNLGTRHRAAIGLSEKYDAVTVIVSEETGQISLTVDGTIQLDLTPDRLKDLLAQYLLSK